MCCCGSNAICNAEVSTPTHPWASAQAFDWNTALETLDAAFADLKRYRANDEMAEAEEDALSERLDQVYPPVPAICHLCRPCV